MSFNNFVNVIVFNKLCNSFILFYSTRMLNIKYSINFKVKINLYYYIEHVPVVSLYNRHIQFKELIVP